MNNVELCSLYEDNNVGQPFQQYILEDGICSEEHKVSLIKAIGLSIDWIKERKIQLSSLIDRNPEKEIGELNEFLQYVQAN